jgi:hypothetical protein
MKKIILITIIALLLAVGIAWSYGSISCIVECQNHGGSYQYCKRICGG